MEAVLPGLSALEAHRSIRHFTDAPIPPEDVERMLRLAQRASSGGAGQLYSLIRVTDSALRGQVAEAAGQAHIAAAAEFFVACVDVNRLRRLLEERGLQPGVRPVVLYATTDALLALANLAAAAEIMGYGVCYVGSIQRLLAQLIALLRLPPGVCPLLGLCVGVPDEAPPLGPRLPLEVLVHENHYREPEPDDLERCRDAMAAATYGGGWIESISRSFTAGGEYEQREAHWRRALQQQGFSEVQP